MKKVCIITPDIVGPIKNGGIGTASFYLARYLKNSLKYDVTILYTSGLYEHRSLSFYQSYYKKEFDITFKDVPHEYFSDKPIFSSTYNQYISYAVYQFLKKNNFDAFIFTDWKGHGFYTVRAKNLLNEFSDSLILTIMHSPTDWQLEGMGIDVFDVLEKEKTSYMERYSCENPDILISPSKHMFSWAEERGWKLSKRKLIIPNLYHKNFAENTLYEPDRSHLIFFGRLESRKGLKTFCTAFEMSYPQNGVRKITFLGKLSQEDTALGADFLDSFKQKFSDLEIIIKSNLDTEQAKQYIRNVKGLVIMPSQLDNFPYTVIECLCEGFPFLASNVGGIPEMVDKRFTFEPASGPLSKLFLKLNDIDFKKQKAIFSLDDAKKKVGGIIIPKRKESQKSSVIQRF